MISSIHIRSVLPFSGAARPRIPMLQCMRQEPAINGRSLHSRRALHDSLKRTVKIRGQPALTAPVRPSIFQRSSLYNKSGMRSRLVVNTRFCTLSKSDKNCFRSQTVLRYKMHWL